MKSFFSQNKKKIIAISLSVFLLAVFFFSPSIARAANDGEGVAKVLGWIIFPFVWVMGKLAVILLGILVKVAQYNDFIGSAAVTYGWVVVRDLCNMFFVLILLIIAFASILRVDSYNLKTWLPKLVIMAVLINFSKLICGIFIDFSQVIMLTFVNAFKDIAGANLTDMLGLTKILDFSQTGSSEVTAWTIIGSMILALVLSVIAVVVILTMLVMLAMRIVYLWVYIVLSPIAYLTAAFPQGKTKSERWWSEFSQYVIVGPVLAFFIWLAFVSLGGVAGSDEMKNFGVENTGNEFNQATTTNVALTEAGSEENLIKFIISVGMLLGGLMLAQEMGGKVGAIAGKGMAKLQTMGAGSIKLGKRATFIERGENAIKAYKQRKESDRSALAQKDAGRLSTAEGYAKMGVAYIPNKVGQGASYIAKRPFGLNDAKLEGREKTLKEEEKDLKTMKEKEVDLDLRGSLNTIASLESERNDRLHENDKIKDQADNLAASQSRYKSLEQDLYFMDQNGVNRNDPARVLKQQEFDDEDEKLKTLKQEAGLGKNANEADVNAKVAALRTEHLVSGGAINQSYDNQIAAKKVETVTKYNALTGEARDFNDLNTNRDVASNTISGQIKSKENKILKDREALLNDKKMADKIDKGTGAVVGTALGTVVGAAFGAPLPFIGMKIAGTALMGGAAGGLGGWAAKSKLKNAGQKDLNLASSYNSASINKHKEEIKDKKTDEIRKIADDQSKTVHERAAAQMLLMEKGEFTHSEAEVARNQIEKDFKGDNKTLNQLDAALNTNYQDLSRPIRDLKENAQAAPNESAAQAAKREEKYEKAKEKIVRGVVSGSIKLDNIDDQETLDIILPKLANTISATNLSNIYKGQTTKKQEMIEKSLKIAADGGDNKSATALVNVQGDLGGLNNESQKTKYMEKVNKTQLNDLFDTAKGINGIADWIVRDNAGILAEIKRAGGDTKKTIDILNRVLKKSQLDMNNSKDKSLTNKLIRALEKKNAY